MLIFFAALIYSAPSLLSSSVNKILLWLVTSAMMTDLDIFNPVLISAIICLLTQKMSVLDTCNASCPG